MKQANGQEGIAHQSLIFLIIALALAVSILAYFNQAQPGGLDRTDTEEMNYFNEP